MTHSVGVSSSDQLTGAPGETDAVIWLHSQLKGSPAKSVDHYIKTFMRFEMRLIVKQCLGRYSGLWTLERRQNQGGQVQLDSGSQTDTRVSRIHFSQKYLANAGVDRSNASPAMSRLVPL